MNYKLMISNIRKELKIYIVGNNLESLVIGISGGIDSALVAILAKPVCDELNIKLIGRSLPMGSNQKEEIERAKKIGELFCHDFKEYSLEHSFLEVAYDVNEIPNVRPGDEKRAVQDGNIKARLRMIYLYEVASVNRGMVLSTDNYTEYLLGFWTIHGDSPYDWGGIQELWKSEVYDMAEWICDNELWKGKLYGNKYEALKECIKAQATDGLGITNTDLDQILPEWNRTSREGYIEVDKRLKRWLDTGAGDLEDPVIHRHIKSQFKRNWPINIDRNKIFEKK